MISLQKMKLDSVQQTVQKEIKTFSDVVKENCSGKSSAVTPGNLKQAMRTAIVNEERHRNFLIFGADEKLLRDERKINDEDLVEEIFSTINVDYTVEKCRRVGFLKPDSIGRPIKVTLRSPDEVRHVLSESKILKSIVTPGFSSKFNKLYLSPDRTEEERKSRQELVKEMKNKIAEDSSKRYFIKNNRVMTAEL